MALVARAGDPAPCSWTLEPGGLPLAYVASRQGGGRKPLIVDLRERTGVVDSFYCRCVLTLYRPNGRRTRLR